MSGALSAVGSIFGGRDKVKAPEIKVPNINAGGISLRTKGDTTRATASAQRQALINQISGLHRQEASGLRGLQPQLAGAFDTAISETNRMLGDVRPGFGRLTDAAVTSLDRGKQSAASNLRSELNQRRILGSSFAADKFSQMEIDFAEREKLARSESFLQELDMTNQLNEQRLQQETAAIDGQMQLMTQALQADRAAEGVQVDEMNNLFNAAQGMASIAANIASTNAQLRYQADLENANAKAEGLGFLTSVGMNAAGVGDWIPA